MTMVEEINQARQELGYFNCSGRPLADCVRDMRMKLEEYQKMIDDLVREIVKREQ